MKTLITFFAIAILYIALLTFQSDGTRITIFQTEAERFSRESAAGAAQLFDAEAYAQGYLMIDEAAAEQFVGDYIHEQVTQHRRLSKGNLEWNIDVKNPESTGENRQLASVTARLVYKGEDFFRLPFLSKDNVIAQVKYEVSGR